MSNLLDALFPNANERGAEAARARLRVAVTEHLLITMEDLEVSKAELARRVGVSRSAVTQALAGNRNMTLNAIADFARALGQEIVVKFQDSQPQPQVEIARGSTSIFTIALASQQQAHQVGQIQLQGLSSSNVPLTVAGVL